MKRIAETENGILQGMQGTDARITVYKGVPFAAPPVGENRWRAPQPCENWEGIRTAYTYGPISMQDTPGLGDDVYCHEWHVDPDIPMSEDCLYLNIWTPAKSPDEKLPVLYWIYGGAFQWGYTAEMEFDAERLAARGIVVVTVAYRLGAFGFLAHPEITKESPDAPGNFGLLDQRAGLFWVKRNIAAFGGDPDRITVAGQSAGGCSVINQITSETNGDLIKGAMIFSGIIRFDEKQIDQDLFRAPTLEEAEKQGEDLFAYLGVESLAQARDLDASFIVEKYAAYREDHPFLTNIIDGHFCKGDPQQRLAQGLYPNIPLISGNTTDEFIEEGINIVERSVKRTFGEILQNRPDAKLYYYRFGAEIPGDDHPGCFHSCDLWFFFETLMKCRRPFVGKHYDLARQMCNYVAAFVKFGDPNCKDADGSEQDKWELYTAADKEGMDFTLDGPVLSKHT
ncbi:MAG: carboxylesterase family protein [Lachnospiraceae bacterium]|nr:carboxylesterase family protein [Lachnospiraceae bacterium]